MLVETNQMMPITKLQKNLTQTIRKVAEEKKTVYILKNNVMEAVMIPFEKYEYLSALEEAMENSEIAEMIKTRMKGYKESESVSWESVREE